MAQLSHRLEPRFAQGKGQAHAKGLDDYKRLVDALLAKNIVRQYLCPMILALLALLGFASF